MLRETRPLLFAALLAAFLWLSWRVLSPFVPGMLWAAVLVVTFRPLHDRLSRTLRGRRWAATTIVTLLVALFVVVPVTIAAVRVVQQTVQAYAWTQDAYAAHGPTLGLEQRLPWLGGAIARLTELAGAGDADLRTAGLNGLRRVGPFVAQKAPALVGGAFGLGFSFVVMLAMIVVFFAEGRRLVEALAAALPVPRRDAERIITELGEMTRTVFVSVGLTALSQASLAAVAMAILGVPRSVNLGAAMFFASLLPGGTAIVWIPVVIYLFANGHSYKAIILAAWCAGVVSTIDNVLRPFFAKGGVKLSSTTLMLGMLGGLSAFGIVGVFLGPLVLYVLMELVAVMRREVYGEAA